MCKQPFYPLGLSCFVCCLVLFCLFYYVNFVFVVLLVFIYFDLFLFSFHRTQGESRMASFFGNNFSEERWRKAALKNAYSLLSKQRFHHAVAFFLLAGALWDAVQLCVSRLKDVQLALVISRLYESDTDNLDYKRVLTECVLGADEQSCPAKKGEINISQLYIYIYIF